MTEPTTYRAVPSESLVTFHAESSVHPITASVAPSAWLTAQLTAGGIEAGTPAEGHLDIPVGDLSSGNPLIDREMKRRMGAGAHPSILGDLTVVLGVDGPTADIEGRISFRGEEVAVEGRIELTEIAADRIVVEGEGRFDLRWWGLEPPRLLMLKVSPEITVRIRLVMEPEPTG